MANSHTKTCENNINLQISPKKISTAKKSQRKKIVNDIMVRISALFNSGGGQLTLEFEEKPCTYEEVGNCIKIVEQRMQTLTSTATVSVYITMVTSENEIIMSIPASSHLVVLNSNLYLPVESEVLLVPPVEPDENVKEILQGNTAKINPTIIDSHCKQFFQDQNVGFRESKVAQLKFVKAEATNNVTVAKRICGKTNKFCSYVSAFANHSGGHIYFGVNEDGIVIGENLCEEDRAEITKEVQKAINKMKWPNHIVQMGGPKQGKQWQVFFEPVSDDKGDVIPSLFVVVVFIAQCPGGVFAAEPESYHIVNNEVKRMSFSEWLLHFQDHPNLQVPLVTQPISSEITDRELHGAFTETPESSGVLSGQLPLSIVPEQSSHSQDRSSPQSIPLQVPPALPISSEIKDRDSHGAFTETPESFQVMSGQAPLPSVPEQSAHIQDSSSSAPLQVSPVLPTSSEVTNANDFTEDYKHVRNNENRCEKVLSDAEKKMLKNPRGNALRLMVLSAKKVIVAYKKHNFKKAEQLLSEYEEQLLKSSKKDAKQFKPKARYLKSCLESVKGNYKESFEIARDGLKEMELIQPNLISSKDQIDFYLHAAMLATILYCKRGEVESLEIYRAQEYLKKATRLAEVSKVSSDLHLKLHIYKACVLLRCSLTGEASHSSRVSEKDIKTAINELWAVETMVREGYPISHYRNTQYLLVKSDLFHRHQFNYTTAQLKCAYENAEEGKALAKKYHFNEMALYASKRMAVITQKLLRVHFFSKWQ